MTKVCTQAGLNRNENRLLTPDIMFARVLARDGELSLDDDEERLSGEGSIWLEERLFRGSPPWPDSSA